jgi:uncharacterized membrane protein
MQASSSSSLSRTQGQTLMALVTAAVLLGACAMLVLYAWAALSWYEQPFLCPGAA